MTRKDLKLIAMGIDPGLAIMGYGVVEKVGYQYKAIDYGVIETPAHTENGDRLLKIWQGLNQLFQQYRPDAVGVEELFFNRNVTTAIQVAQARGVALLAVRAADIPLFEYTPLQVKQAVVGYGRAEKNQIQQMMRIMLGLKEIPKPDDAADALAIAITHLNSAVMLSKGM